MAQWYCYQCQEEMVEDIVELEFQRLKGSVEGIKCPKCGTQYLSEETVLEKVLRAEKMAGTK